MRAPRLLLVLAITLFAVQARAAVGPVSPPDAHDADAIDRTAQAAYRDGRYSFCKEPSRPLGLRQRGLCSLAAEIEGCEGFAKACALGPLPKERGWLERIAGKLGLVATGLLYLLVMVVVVLLAVPVVRAIVRGRRGRKLAAPSPQAPNRAALVDETHILADEISDAEAALRLADEHRSRGESKKALGLYLAASLAALDRRGAIRIARHRTNGEYIRACSEEAARPPLREIVREVDKAEFGDTSPTDVGVLRVASCAEAIVRAAATTMTILAIALFGAGCGAPPRGADPAGVELPIEILERNGFQVRSLETSLATMPISEDSGEGGPVVIVDVEKVPLEEEARSHLMRWVEAGGVLVLFGQPDSWPSELRSSKVSADTRDLVVRTGNPDGAGEDPDSEEDSTVVDMPIEIEGARTARPDAFRWRHSLSLDVAFLGESAYASQRRVGKGIVLGVANDDLFTNVGVMPRRNAAALVTLIRAVSRDPGRKLPVGPSGAVSLDDIRVARAEDGIPPPANPFAALVSAGLGKGAWHALIAAVLLFLAYGIRHARPRRVATKERRVFAEHVEATGAFYTRARAHAHALSAYGRYMETRLRETIPRGADPVAFLAARTGVDREHVAVLYARATTAKTDDEPRSDDLLVIEELRRMMASTSTHRL